MAQMMKCPRCGAANSVRRATCYACEAPLHPAAGPPQQSAASRRFAAVLEQEGGRAPETPEVRRELPVAYAGIAQVRRAMVFFRQLHGLVESGLPLAQALFDLAARGDSRTRAALRAMAQHVASGGRLSDAMRSHPGLFLEYQAGLVQAGEVGGALPQALGGIASDCEAEYQLRMGMVLALFPIFLVAPVLLAAAPLALVLRGAAPPQGWTLTALEAHYVSTLLRVSLPLGSGFAAAWAFWLAAPHHKRLAAWQQRVILSLPLIGGAARRTGIARFLGSLSALVNAGVPIAEAYTTSALAAGNRALASELLREVDNLCAGRGLAETLGRLRVVSGTVMDRIAVGETVGKLPQVLGEVAADYRSRAQRAARHLPRLVQLAAYAVLAPLVGLVVYALWATYWNFRFWQPLHWIDDLP